MSKKDLSEKREKELEALEDEVGHQILQAFMKKELSLQEGLTVLSSVVSGIIAIAAGVIGEDEEVMLQKFCDSLKLEENEKR